MNAELEALEPRLAQAEALSRLEVELTRRAAALELQVGPWVPGGKQQMRGGRGKGKHVQVIWSTMTRCTAAVLLANLLCSTHPNLTPF